MIYSPHMFISTNLISKERKEKEKETEKERKGFNIHQRMNSWASHTQFATYTTKTLASQPKTREGES
jgi:hypothetical protein